MGKVADRSGKLVDRIKKWLIEVGYWLIEPQNRLIEITPKYLHLIINAGYSQKPSRGWGQTKVRFFLKGASYWEVVDRMGKMADRSGELVDRINKVVDRSTILVDRIAKPVDRDKTPHYPAHPFSPGRKVTLFPIRCLSEKFSYYEYS
ncbi:hypothetical protein FZC78_10420 [Rossellomorea vietnamensis]|uniref:Uncharacterized protein n=1 Tax=Rossellomorea vietnamensis TaxID=218284 RepID=A0A5D4NRR6_9BACI|nr:hypothetical protein [Rossellomorea vietnamensis]TYS17033.1 hypothetical protein FZC78_10420 [Rossellomorea vietnamensis]